MLTVKESDPGAAKLAANFIKQKKLIAFATDTVYGIAADATNADAVEQIYQLKGRSYQNPIAILVADLKTAQKLLEFDPVSSTLAKKFLPGPLTLVLKRRSTTTLANNLNQNNEFIGFRIIAKKFITDLFAQLDGATNALALTSANPSSLPAALTSNSVTEYFKTNPELKLLVDGGTSEQQSPSTVIKVVDGKIEVLRKGQLSFGD